MLPPVLSSLFCIFLSSLLSGFVPTILPFKFPPITALFTNGSTSVATQRIVVNDEVKTSLIEAEVVPSCWGLK